jgi:hypothetical protein
MTALGGAGEAAVLGDRKEILQPIQVHNDVLFSIHADTALAPQPLLVQCKSGQQAKTAAPPRPAMSFGRMSIADRRELALPTCCD